MTYPGPGGNAPWGGPPQQQPWPQQAPYPQYPQGGYPPPVPKPPLTLPGWGALPAVLGTVAALIGLFVLDWIPALGLFEVSEVLGQYVSWVAIALIAVQTLQILPWTLGAVRSKTWARWIVNTSGKSLALGKLGPTRTLEGLASLLVTGIYVALLFVISQGHLDSLAAGPWVTVAGSALLTLGAAIGPRLPKPQQPYPYPYPGYPPQQPYRWR